MKEKIVKMKEKATIILSGGMDSTTLLYDLVSQGYEVYALCFNYGQRHSREIECAKESCKILNVPIKVLNLDVLNEIAPSALTRSNIDVPDGDYDESNMKTTVVPNRNMVMLSLATAYAISIGSKKVFYGAHAGDHVIYPDCRKTFVDAMRNSILLCDWTEVELLAPYVDKDKGDIAIIGKKLNVDYTKTTTCYKGEELACGTCGSCKERLDAFKKAGMKDPIKYKSVDNIYTQV